MLRLRSLAAPGAAAALCACLLLASVAPAAEVERGKSIYEARCGFCHGMSGKGDGPAGVALKPPPGNLASAEYWSTASVATIKAVIADGKPGTAMVPFKWALSPEQIDDVVAYVETFKPAP